MWLLLIYWSKISFLFGFFLRLAAEDTNGIDNHVPANTAAPSACCPCVVNGGSTPSPSQAAARPKTTPAPKPLTPEPASDTGKHGYLWHVIYMETKFMYLYVYFSYCTIFLNLQFYKRNLKITPPEFFFFIIWIFLGYLGRYSKTTL